MSKIINTILLSTTLLMMSCSNSHSTMIYNPLYDLDGIFLRICEVENNDPNNIGKLYYQDGDNKQYLIDEEGRPFFDLSYVDKPANITEAPIRNLLEAGGGNIIIKNHTSNKYTLKHPLILTGNTNLIIPKNITLTKSNSPDALTPLNILFESGCNNTLLVIGKIKAMNDTNLQKSVVDFGKYTSPQNAIMMPNAKIIFAGGSVCKQEDTKSTYGCSFVSSCVCETKIVPYPGAQLIKNINTSTNSDNSIATFGNLYLNRFCETTNIDYKNLLEAKVSANMHIIYPAYENGNLRTTNIASGNNTGDYTYTSDFINLYFTGAFDTKKVNVNYSFEDAMAPLTFNLNKEKNKLVLGFNPENELAKYDSKLWNECCLNIGKYNLSYYNVSGNKGCYIDVDEMYKHFANVYNENILSLMGRELVQVGRQLQPQQAQPYQVQHLQLPLVFLTDSIYAGLIGNRYIMLTNNKNILELERLLSCVNFNILLSEIRTLSNINMFSPIYPEKKSKISLYGDNSEYHGIVLISHDTKSLYLYNNSLPAISCISPTDIMITQFINYLMLNTIIFDNPEVNTMFIETCIGKYLELLDYISRVKTWITLPNLTFYLLGNNKLDLMYYNPLLMMNFDNTTETSSSGTIEIVDSNCELFKRNALFFLGNYDKYEGTVKIPDSIKYVKVKSDIFTKLKHGNNEDLSGLTYHLLEDVQVDLNNIKDSTFEMSLSNDYTNSNYNSIKLIDSSNPTKITKVTFSGDNTKYKKAGNTDPNTGIVELTPYINEVEFINAPKSLVQLQAFSTTRTVLVNNVLSLEISKIKVIPADYAETVKYTSISEKDSINNIEQYNKPGIIWDTNTIEDCFSNGTELLSNLDLNVIRADLKGDKGIIITTADNIITLLGNNSKYTGTITIPENVTDIFLRRISKIKNIVHAEDADLSKLNFHYEEIKPEAKSDKFCVPFTNMKKVIDSKHELCKEVKDTKEKLDKATDQITQLTTEKEENQTKLNIANDRIAELETENTNNSNDLQTANNRIAELDAENEENKDKLSKAEDDINALNKKNEDNKYRLSKAEELIAKLSKENDENKSKLNEAKKYIYYINKRNTSPKHNKYFDEFDRQPKIEKYSDKNAKYFNEVDKYNSREYLDKNSRYDSFYKDNVSPKYNEKQYDDFKEQDKSRKYEEHHNKYLEEDNKYDNRDYEYKPRRKHYNPLYNLDNLFEFSISDDESSEDYIYEIDKDGTVKRYRKDV